MPGGELGTTYPDGAVIVRRGEPGDCMYVVQAGQVEVVYEADGREQRFGVIAEGGFFGEMALFETEMRSATVRALGEARVLKVDKRTLLRRIKEDPLLALNLLKTLSARLREARQEQVESR
ncbi:MAG TPA: cyclic nucleotide-binding domain-containing protein [Acidimicrobiales bacterium]|nr:cyclic nucleotide-binding domain-containing protein [Acidimicrobiales bacterium]